MANGFGAYTDHFGILLRLAGAGPATLADVLVVTAADKTPDPMSRGEAMNDCGDPVAATWYGNTAGLLFDVTNTYVVKTGTLNLEDLQGGEVAVGVFIGNIDVGTSNDGWPQITVTGKLGAEAMVHTDLGTWTMPTIAVLGKKCAQVLDFTVDAGCRLTGSGLTATVDLAQQEDGEGEPVAHGVSGGLLTITADMVYVTAACAWTPAVAWTESQAPGDSQGQAAYGTASAAAEQIWVRDETP
jgi:hypothetical protein